MKKLKELIEEIRKEEAAKAKAAAYEEIVQRHPEAITSEIEMDLNRAVKEAITAAEYSVRRLARLELEETARLSGCSHPDLLSKALQDHLDVASDGSLVVIDPKSKLPLRDNLTGRPMGLDGLIGKARQSADYAPLFGNSQNNVKSAGIDLKNVQNPWKKQTLNLTKQARILRENPELAAILMEQAQK